MEITHYFDLILYDPKRTKAEMITETVKKIGTREDDCMFFDDDIDEVNEVKAIGIK